MCRDSALGRSAEFKNQETWGRGSPVARQLRTACAPSTTGLAVVT